MKRRMATALVAAVMTASFIGTMCMAAEATTFNVGFDAAYPPYGYMDENGEYTGFDLELAQAVCELQGWELIKTPIDWDSKDMELNSGAIDCIWNGFTINGREDDYTWSVPYVDNSQVVVVAESSGIEDLAGLSGKIVGVQAASAALELLSEGGDQADLAATFSMLQQYPEYNSAFLELAAGSIDAVGEGPQGSSGGGHNAAKSLLKGAHSVIFGLGSIASRQDIMELIEKDALPGDPELIVIVVHPGLFYGEGG